MEESYIKAVRDQLGKKIFVQSTRSRRLPQTNLEVWMLGWSESWRVVDEFNSLGLGKIVLPDDFTPDESDEAAPQEPSTTPESQGEVATPIQWQHNCPRNSSAHVIGASRSDQDRISWTVHMGVFQGPMISHCPYCGAALPQMLAEVNAQS